MPWSGSKAKKKEVELVPSLHASLSDTQRNLCGTKAGWRKLVHEPETIYLGTRSTIDRVSLQFQRKKGDYPMKALKTHCVPTPVPGALPLQSMRRHVCAAVPRHG
jgi:hypothetical protein